MPRVVTKKSGLSGKLKSTGPVVQKMAGPVWLGPQSDQPQGGISQSLLWSFINCRTRFGLRVIEGLKQADEFSRVLEFGNAWHVCEEELAAKRDWSGPLKTYCNGLLKKYPMQQEEIAKWYEVIKLYFPIYVAYWSKQKDVVDRTPLLQEQVFHVPYRLPSNRTVWLKGKFDAVDLIGKGRNAGVFLFENKTKGEIDEQKLVQQLHGDLQVMFYLTALSLYDGLLPKETDRIPVKGVRYNVIRRPLSGGRGTIQRHKATKNKSEETEAEYYERLRMLIQEDVDGGQGDYWFMRMKVEISQSEVAAFQRECLNPLLEQVCDWYEWMMSDRTSVNKIHWRHPFGGFNQIDNGWTHHLDEYMRSGSELGLVRGAPLFGEL